MKVVKWEDEEGFKHLSILDDKQPDTKAAQGLLIDPPDIRGLEWENMVKELHNLLVERGLVNVKDLADKPGQLENAIRLVISRPIIELYKLNGGTQK